MNYKLLTICIALTFSILSCSKTQSENTLNNEPTNKSASNKSGTGGGGTGGNPTDTTKTPPNDTTKTPPNDTSKGGGENPIDTNCIGVICTHDFRAVHLKVHNTNGDPIILDSYYTEDMSGNKLPNSLYEYNYSTESYVVFNDSWMNGHQNSTTQVRFVGIKNGVKVVQEVYNISTDCCHISKTSGKDKVVLP